MKQLLKYLFMKQRKSSKAVCSIVICCLFLASCRNQFSPTPTQKTPRGAWLAKFLQNPTCQPPCWENMVPGVTSIQEVRDRLSDRKDIQITSWNPDRNVIEWRTDGGRIGGRAESWYDGDLVRYFQFGIDLEALTLGEFIIHYGEPDYVNFIYFDSTFCDVRLIYLSQGISLSIPSICKPRNSLFGSNPSLSINIKSDALISRISLYQSGEEGYLKTWGPDSIGNLEIEWKGFGDYIK